MYLAHLEKLSRTRLADVLVEEGVLERPKVEEAQAEQEVEGKQLGEILIERDILSDYDLAKLVATHYSMPYLDLQGYSMRREVLELLPTEFCLKYAILPLDQFGAMLTLAVAEMPDVAVIEEIVQQTKLTPILFVALRRGLIETLETEKKRGARPEAKAPLPKAATPGRSAAAGAPASGPAPELPLPEFDLPTVSMKLVSGAAQRAPATAGRAGHGAHAAAAKSPSTEALNWMDAVGGSAPAQAEPPRPKISRYTMPGETPAAAGARPGPKTGSVSVRPAGAAPKPSATAAPAPAEGGAWQSIFDVADESVKKGKPKDPGRGAPPPSA